MPNEEWLAPDDVIPVSEEDCEKAIASNQYQCAITRAIWRKYPQARRVRVNKGYIAFSIGEERFRYPTPEAAVESIIEPLDTGGKPEPGLVRLTGGLVREVEHRSDPNHQIQAEREHRQDVLKARIARHNENVQVRSEYGRFIPKDAR